MRIYSFQGLHYDFGNPTAGTLAAPPYDQIDEAFRDRLHRVSPHHLSHLTRPLPGSGLDQYENASRFHAQWLREGIVERDPEPALYPYVIDFPSGIRRVGLCALVRIEGADSAAIRPHEHTLDKPLADRLELMRATQVDLEPALLLSDDGGDLDALLEEDIEGREPLVSHSDADGYSHLLFRVTDPARVETYRQVLERGDGAIADGHHRYKVSRRYAEETGAVEGTAAASKLAVITSLESPALSIDPIHRGLREVPDLAPLSAALLERAPWGGGSGGADFARAVAEAYATSTRPTIGTWIRGEGPEIWTLDPAGASEALSPGARDLPVALLHDSVFSRFGLLAESATDGTVLYRSNPEDIWTMVAEGEAGAGFWLPPMTPTSFSAAIAKGDMLPPKSTRFLPKVVSGLVWSDHGSRLG